MKNELITGTAGTALSVLGTVIQTNELLQFISLIISIVGGLITFIVVPLLTWYNKAKADGKITKEELKEAKDTIKNGVDKLKK